MSNPSHLIQRGAIAVEFAILLVPLLMIVFGITEFGRAIYEYNTLTKATRDAARFLTTRSPGDAAAHTAAKNMVVYGSATATGQPLLSGLTTEMVSICDKVAATACPGEAHISVITGAGAINLVTVNVGGVGAKPYTFSFLAPYVSASPSINFGRIHTTMEQII